MPKPSWLLRPNERQVQQEAARKQAKEKKKGLVAKMAAPKARLPKTPKIQTDGDIHQAAPVALPSPLSEACIEKVQGIFFDREHPDAPLHPERWTQEIVNLILRASTEGGLHICFVWPGRPESVPLLHVLATLARLAIKDLKGLRTLLYPVKQTTFYSFNHHLLDRNLLVNLIQQVWVLENNQSMLQALRPCDGKSELLMALANIKEHKPDTPFPTVAEIIPTFRYDSEKEGWGNYNERLLARSITKLPLSYRRTVRSTLRTHLGLPASAPDAIFGIPYGLKKGAWTQAISKLFVQENPIELLLLDATDDMQRTHFKTVQQIPEFLSVATERLGKLPGTVLITDNPATAFHLRKRLLEDFELKATLHIYPTESDSKGFSSEIQQSNFAPALRSLKHYDVTIMDREASGLALTMHKLAGEFSVESEMQQACLNIAQYMMQLCHLPGGYCDLGEWLEEEERHPFLVNRLTWPHRAATLRRLLISGNAGALTRSVERALDKAECFITDWTDATPMALRILREVSGIATKSKRNIGFVFLQPSYIPIVERFLKRKLEGTETPYATVRPRLEFIGFREFHKRTGSFAEIERFIFVGVADDLLRVLLTTDDVPAHSSLFVSYRHAQGYLQQLSILRSLEELRAYQGRIRALAQEFERRLKAIPNPLAIERLKVPSFNFDFNSPPDENNNIPEQQFWRLELEGGETLYTMRRVFKYQPDEDPAFKSTNVESIEVGDSVFCMTDDLREEIEATLRSLGFSSFSHGSTFAKMLDFYHMQVKNQSNNLFPAKNKREQARKILSRMIEINAEMEECALSRVSYWLDLDRSEEDRAPKAARDWKHFEAFARALEMPEPLYKDFWVYAINSTRREHQVAGRELSDFYTNILFNPESLQVYRKIPPETISRLTQRALDSVFTVECKIAPTVLSSASSQETS